MKLGQYLGRGGQIMYYVIGNMIFKFIFRILRLVIDKINITQYRWLILIKSIECGKISQLFWRPIKEIFM